MNPVNTTEGIPTVDVCVELVSATGNLMEQEVLTLESDPGSATGKMYSCKHAGIGL